MMTSGLHYERSIKDSKSLMKVALGQERADLAIINARLLNVYSGELLDRHSIVIKGEWIAYVGDDPGDTIGPQTEVIEKLRLGLCVMIREGSVRRDLEAISRIKDFVVDFRRLILVSDGLEPKDLLEKGGRRHGIYRPKGYPLRL